MTRAIIRRDGHWWSVTYDGQFRGRMRLWCDAIKHANCVVELARRGEPTA